jgi:hypothetical protein
MEPAGNRVWVGRVFSQGVRRESLAAERLGRSPGSRPRVLVVVQELVQGRAEPRGGILRHDERECRIGRDGRARRERGRGRGWGRGLPGFAGVSWCGLECACRHRERFRAETPETSPRASCRSGSAESLRGRFCSRKHTAVERKRPFAALFWPRDKPTQRCARRGVPPPRGASRRARVDPPVRPRRGVVAPREVRERLAVRRRSSPEPSRRRMFSTQTSPSREKTLATPRLARSPSPRSARPRWR